jgi:cysteinyl-tRNA synthetase
MPLKVYNTLTRKKELFKPIKEGEVTMYSCGPTVYAPPHIGNYRSFLFADLLKRYLEFKGFKVRHVMNLTDIDDKTIKNSAAEGMGLKEFTDKYANIFFDGLDKLNVEGADVYAHATDHVEEMIQITKALVEKGYAYVAPDGVYFSISKFKDYGKLSKLDKGGIKSGARVNVDEYAKDNPMDFALMKRSTTEELKRGICYDTEWGKMRPGWHIECSTLSMHYLGETIDIHTGGIDLIFPHHENEIAQSESYTGKKFVNYWIHNEFIQVEGQKMAKSLGNYYTLEDLLAKGFDPKAIRYMLISTHYKQLMNFTFNGVDAAKKTVDGMMDFLRNLRDADGKENPKVKELIKKAEDGFVESMDDDLNINEAMASVFNFISEMNKLMAKKEVGKENSKDAIDMMLKFDKVLGLKFEEALEEGTLPPEVEKLIRSREEARKRGDWKLSDEIRGKIKELGYLVEDTDSGMKWKKVK